MWRQRWREWRRSAAADLPVALAGIVLWVVAAREAGVLLWRVTPVAAAALEVLGARLQTWLRCDMQMARFVESWVALPILLTVASVFACGRFRRWAVRGFFAIAALVLLFIELGYRPLAIVLATYITTR